MKRLIALFLFACSNAFGVVYTVSNSDSAATIYNTIQNAACGDTVRITAGNYTLGTGLVRIYINGKRCGAGNPLTIQGFGGMAVFNYTAHPLDTHTTLPCDNIPGTYSGGDCDRGGWVFWNSSYIVLDSVHIKGVTSASSDNAAGLRMIGDSAVAPTNTDHISFRNCIFELNYNGVQVGGIGATNTLYYRTKFLDNGNPSNEQEHQLYDGGGDNTTIQESYFDATHCCIHIDGTSDHVDGSGVHTDTGGQNLHLRAYHTYLISNWIANAKQYEFDMMTPNPAFDPGDHVMHGYAYGNVIVPAVSFGTFAKVITTLDDTATFTGGRFSWHIYWNTFYFQSDTCYQGNSGEIPPNTTDQCSIFQQSNFGINNSGIYVPPVIVGLSSEMSNNVFFMKKRPDDASARSLFVVTWGTNPPCTGCNNADGPVPWTITGTNNTFDDHMINLCSTPQTYTAANGSCSLTNGSTFAYGAFPFTNAATLNLMPSSAGALGTADLTVTLPYPIVNMQTAPGVFAVRSAFTDRGALQTAGGGGGGSSMTSPAIFFTRLLIPELEGF